MTDNSYIDENGLVLKIKMKGFLIAGILVYIDIITNKVIKTDCIVINGGTLLSRFDVNRSHTILLDSLFSIKLRNEKFDVDYTNQFNELFLTEVNKTSIIKKIVKAAKEQNIRTIEDILNNILKYTITNHFELIINTEFANIDVNQMASKEAAAKEIIEKAFEIEPVTAPVKGTPVFNLLKGEVIHVRFVDNSPMGIQIKQHLYASSNEEFNPSASGPKLLGTIIEMIPVKQKSSKVMQLIIELTPEIYGKMELPVNVKVRKYNPTEDDDMEPPQQTKDGQTDSSMEIKSDKNKDTNTSNISFGNIILTAIIIFLVAILIIMLFK